MCWRRGTSTRREPASWANAASRTAGSGAVSSPMAASCANGLGSAATARIPAATARRAVQPVPAHGSSTVSPGVAKAASAASSWLSAGAGWYRSRRAETGEASRQDDVVESRPLRLGHRILWLFYQLLFELGLTGVLGQGGVELLDLLRVLVGLLDSRPRHRTEVRCPSCTVLRQPPPGPASGTRPFRSCRGG